MEFKGHAVIEATRRDLAGALDLDEVVHDLGNRFADDLLASPGELLHRRLEPGKVGAQLEGVGNGMGGSQQGNAQGPENVPAGAVFGGRVPGETGGEGFSGIQLRGQVRGALQRLLGGGERYQSPPSGGV